MTSIPASRSARAMTFAPRSWPSRPGFAIRTRIFFGIGTTSVEERFLPYAEHLAHHVANLAERRTRPHRVEDVRHRVLVPSARLPQPVEGARVLPRVARPSDPTEALELRAEGRLRHAERLDLRRLVDDVVVHADDRTLPVLDLPLVAVRGVCDLLLEEPLPDRGDDAAEVLDAVEPADPLLL